MGNYFTKQRPKRPRDTEASSPTTSKRRRREKSVELQTGECESESPHLLPSSDSLEKIDVPSASGAKSDPSASSTSVNGNDYYVFLSFRGPDTRNGFVDHLYHRLKDVGLPFHTNFVFRDDRDLPFGEKIGENLISAIKHSKVSIPVISEKYAASEWCLRELIQIMECEERGEQKVLPVLYKVKPYEVRELKGAFGEAFESRKDPFDEKVKQQGLLALKKAVDLRVFESEKFADGREAELVKELVRVIMDEQQHDFLPPLPGNLVGIDDRVAEVMKLADTDPSKIRIIGICGIGSIGKTTLATNVYSKLAKEFEWRSFLIDIKETINRKGMEHIQSLLISDITKNHESRVRDSMMGIGKIRFSCEKKKVLIVLDNVGDRDHLNKLIGGCNFGLGSRIIITCRDKALLESEYKCYELEKMNDKDSMLLFSLYAFGAKRPPAKFVTLSRDIVATLGGLPLALKIIGSYLKREGKDEVIWTEKLWELRKVPPENVREKLEMSYNSLDNQKKRMFLDIACFFIGIDKRIVSYLWKDLGLSPVSGLKRMINLSLIKYGDNNELRMHDHLRDLGRGIARSAAKVPEDWSRLWGKEAMKVLRCKEEIEKNEALHLDQRGSIEFMKQESFRRMPNLKLLQACGVEFDGDIMDSLSELRWLDCMCCAFFEATNVHLKKLVILKLSSCISENWGGWSSIKMERLKVLNLSRCQGLKSTPDFSAFENLEMLILEGLDLEEIGPSIGKVTHLVSLNLRYCYHLKNLPSQLGELTRLVSLDLRECKALEKLPGELGKLQKLKKLIIGRTAIKEIPQCIGSLVELEMLNACHCESLVSIPDSISHLVNLLILDLSFCFCLKRLPKSIGSLVKLQRLLLGDPDLPCDEYLDHVLDPNGDGYLVYDYCFCHIPHSIGKLELLIELNLSSTNISELPKSIGDLENLKILIIFGCEKLRSLPSTISKLGKLEILDAACCFSLRGEVHIDGLSSLKILKLSATCISGLPDTIGKLSCLKELALEECEMIQSLPQSIGKLSSLQDLDISHIDLQSLPELPASITVLSVTCQSHALRQISHLIHLKEMIFLTCNLLESMPKLPFGTLKLCIFRCDKLTELPGLSSLELLSELRILGCHELTEIKGLEGLKSLDNLSVAKCKKLSNLDGLEHLESLRHLKMVELDALLMNDDLILSLYRLKNLEGLEINSCQSLRRPNLSQFTHLKKLIARECHNLVEIKGLERLEKLKNLDIWGCKSIETLPDLSCFDNLEHLNIRDCGMLQDVQGLERVSFVYK